MTSYFSFVKVILYLQFRSQIAVIAIVWLGFLGDRTACAPQLVAMGPKLDDVHAPPTAHRIANAADRVRKLEFAICAIVNSGHNGYMYLDAQLPAEEGQDDNVENVQASKIEKKM